MGWPDADTALLRPFSTGFSSDDEPSAQASSSNAFDNPAQASSSSAFEEPPNSRPKAPKGLHLTAETPLQEAVVDLEEQSPTAELDAGCIGSPQSPADEAAGCPATAVYRPATLTPVPPHLNTRNSWHSGKKPPGADLLTFQFFTVGWLSCVDGPA